MPDVTDRISQVSQIYILAEKQNSNFNGRIKINCEFCFITIKCLLIKIDSLTCSLFFIKTHHINQ